MKKSKKSRKTNQQLNDPFFARESEKYGNPIPSREYILQYLESVGGPLKFKAIQHHFALFEPEQEIALTRRLAAMERDGQIHRDKKSAYGVVDKLDLLAGKVLGHKDGYGFFVADNKSADLANKAQMDWLISAREMRKVFPGERVLVRAKKQHSDGRIEAQIVEVLQSEQPLQIVGRFYRESGIAFVTPQDPRIAQDILIPPDDPMLVQPGQVVVVQITTRPTYRSKAVGHLAQVLGDYLQPGMEIKIAINQFAIRHEWSSEIHNQLQQLPLQVEEKDLAGRVDLRHLPLITIDGKDARDFDDAVYCQPTESGGWKLWVAIADVSHYIKPHSPLDEEAKLRGTSVYFPNAVVPMLPEQISNGLCSLKPEVDRLCMVCEMTLTAKGVVQRSKFYSAVMHSKARMTYDKVWKILQGDSHLRKQHQSILESIEQLYALFKARNQLKQARGAINFETTETQIIFNKNKKIEKIIPLIRNDAHKIIEECMICANVAAAKFFIKHKVPGVYRTHQGPTEKKLQVLQNYLRSLGLFIATGNKVKPQAYQQLMQEIEGRADAENIQIMMLRSMNQAEYSPDNLGHFGLAFDAYTHFTSPIRRYPDLLVHRIIKQVISTDQSTKAVKNNQQKNIYDKNQLAKICQQNSASERNADMASRDVIDWLKCEYMLAHIGNKYQGTVSSITNFGLFVRLHDVHVEGLIHVTELGHEYFHYDNNQQQMRGEKTGLTFCIGDELMIEVVEVNIEQRKIDFTLLKVISSSKPARVAKSEREKLYARAKRKVQKPPANKNKNRKKAKAKVMTSSKKTKSKRR